MKKTRHQKGYVYRKGNLWLVRFYESRIMPDGSIQRVQRAKKLVEAVGEYRSKRAACLLADEFLAPLNDGRLTTQSTMTLAQFVESHYLPFVQAHKRISTLHGYRNLWKRYLRSHGSITLRDFRTAQGERILGEIVTKHDLTSTTLSHIKLFLSGVFRYAKRLGVLNTENPMQAVVLPKARAANDTYAYSLEEIMLMVRIVPEPAATLIFSAAFTGARKGELRGLLWEKYDGEQVYIAQSFWRSHVQAPKTKKSRAPVPVIAQLAERLNLWREMSGNPATGLMFPSQQGKPINLDALVADVIRPTLERCAKCSKSVGQHGDVDHEFVLDASRPAWHGWHAFRRGLATNLHRLGVPDETIQRILRHSTVAVTQNCYIKTAEADVTAAMQLMERSIKDAPSMHLEDGKKSLVM